MAKGWKDEPARHSLARKGIKTTRKNGPKLTKMTSKDYTDVSKRYPIRQVHFSPGDRFYGYQEKFDVIVDDPLHPDEYSAEKIQKVLDKLPLKVINRLEAETGIPFPADILEEKDGMSDDNAKHNAAVFLAAMPKQELLAAIKSANVIPSWSLTRKYGR